MVSLSNTAHRFQELGPVGAFGRILDRIVGQPRTLTFMRLALAGLPPDYCLESDVHQITPEEVAGWSEYNDGWFTREQALQRLLSGRHLFVLGQDGENASFGWVEVGTVAIRWLGMNIGLPGDVVYLSHLYTMPKFRGNACASRLWRGLACYWKRRGAAHLLVAVDPTNAPSVRMHQKLGFEPYESITYRHWSGFRCYRVRDGRTGRRRTFVTVGSPPDTLWKTFWTG